MRKILYHPHRDWLFIKRWALHHDTIIIEYHYNLGRVSKRIYKAEDSDFHNYIVKNQKQLVRENEELLKKFNEMKKLEVC